MSKSICFPKFTEMINHFDWTLDHKNYIYKRQTRYLGKYVASNEFLISV